MGLMAFLVLEYEKMKKLLAALAVSAFAISAVQAAEWGDVDADANGMITMEEAKAMMPDLSADAFKAADSDGDGTLNAEEFAKLKG